MATTRSKTTVASRSQPRNDEDATTTGGDATVSIERVGSVWAIDQEHTSVCFKVIVWLFGSLSLVTGAACVALWTQQIILREPCHYFEGVVAGPIIVVVSLFALIVCCIAAEYETRRVLLLIMLVGASLGVIMGAIVLALEASKLTQKRCRGGAANRKDKGVGPIYLDTGDPMLWQLFLVGTGALSLLSQSMLVFASARELYTVRNGIDEEAASGANSAFAPMPLDDDELYRDYDDEPPSDFSSVDRQHHRSHRHLRDAGGETDGETGTSREDAPQADRRRSHGSHHHHSHHSHNHSHRHSHRRHSRDGERSPEPSTSRSKYDKPVKGDAEGYAGRHSNPMTASRRDSYTSRIHADRKHASAGK